MSRVVELLCSRRIAHVAVLALMSIGFAGCSADMSTRLSQDAFSNPFSQSEATGTVAPRSVAATHSSGQAGTTIIVGTADTLDTLSRRYNVSTAAILQANGYKGPRVLSPGQQLIIPRQTAAVAAPALAAPASKAVAATRSPPTVHVVNRGDTLLSIARRNHV